MTIQKNKLLPATATPANGHALTGRTVAGPFFDDSRFWSKVDFNGPIPPHRTYLGRCWMWKAYRNSEGYGRFRFDGKVRRAHRVSYQITRGPIQSELDHLCMNRPCVNPSHLEDVSHNVNSSRRLIERKMAKVKPKKIKYRKVPVEVSRFIIRCGVECLMEISMSIDSRITRKY